MYRAVQKQWWPWKWLRQIITPDERQTGDNKSQSLQRYNLPDKISFYWRRRQPGNFVTKNKINEKLNKKNRRALKCNAAEKNVQKSVKLDIGYTRSLSLKELQKRVKHETNANEADL